MFNSHTKITLLKVNLQNIDLHALTGWIPERVAIRPKEPDFNANHIFERLQNGLAQGRSLITVATGELSDDEAERTGLVSTHAYAVLDLKEIDVRTFSLNICIDIEAIEFVGSQATPTKESMVTSSLEG